MGKGGRTERVELLARVVDQLLMDLYAVVQRVGAGALGDKRLESGFGGFESGFAGFKPGGLRGAGMSHNPMLRLLNPPSY